MSRINACFCEGASGSPWGHGENMQTPHRKAPLLTPPKVWAPVTWRRDTHTSAHIVPRRESNPEPLHCEAFNLGVLLTSSY